MTPGRSQAARSYKSGDRRPEVGRPPAFRGATIWSGDALVAVRARRGRRVSIGRRKKRAEGKSFGAFAAKMNQAQALGSGVVGAGAPAAGAASAGASALGALA